jgi:hypothetical protein
LPEKQISGKVDRMKTTLDIPNDLYRQAKATAALEGIRMKDLIGEGLRLVLEARGRGAKSLSPLEVLREVRRKPLHGSSEVEAMMDLSERRRLEDWRQEEEL